MWRIRVAIPHLPVYPRKRWGIQNPHLQIWFLRGDWLKMDKEGARWTESWSSLQILSSELWERPPSSQGSLFLHQSFPPCKAFAACFSLLLLEVGASDSDMPGFSQTQLSHILATWSGQVTYILSLKSRFPRLQMWIINLLEMVVKIRIIHIKFRVWSKYFNGTFFLLAFLPYASWPKHPATATHQVS